MDARARASRTSLGRGAPRRVRRRRPRGNVDDGTCVRALGVALGVHARRRLGCCVGRCVPPDCLRIRPTDRTLDESIREASILARHSSTPATRRRARHATREPRRDQKHHHRARAPFVVRRRDRARAFARARARRRSRAVSIVVPETAAEAFVLRAIRRRRRPANLEG